MPTIVYIYQVDIKSHPGRAASMKRRVQEPVFLFLIFFSEEYIGDGILFNTV